MNSDRKPAAQPTAPDASPTGRWYETYRGVVFPWMCDHFGHMNVRWYSHHFDDAGFHLWSIAGVSQSAMRERGTHPVVAQTTIKYIRELKAGDLILIRSGFVKVGEKSVVHIAKMYNADTNVYSAWEETVEVFFDPVARKSAPMPEDLRQRLAAQIVDPESF
ncbi:MAG TPA: thioesterase family protein [Alphaproteobacteria bacterium]|jgi:acyl-CoA thioester hydrolase